MTLKKFYTEPKLDMVSILGPWGPAAIPVQIVPSSSGFEAANRTVYFPISVPVACTVRRFWWVNGATVSGGANITMAIYRTTSGNEPNLRIGTATAVQGAANSLQFVTPANPVGLTPGIYWIAIGSDSNTNTTLFGSGTSTTYDASFRFQEATATPPSNATPTESGTTSIYLCGFSTQSSP
jgi:hypothetical protein